MSDHQANIGALEGACVVSGQENRDQKLAGG
jgi:hypothetical protein